MAQGSYSGAIRDGTAPWPGHLARSFGDRSRLGRRAAAAESHCVSGVDGERMRRPGSERRRREHAWFRVVLEDVVNSSGRSRSAALQPREGPGQHRPSGWAGDQAHTGEDAGVAWSGRRRGPLPAGRAALVPQGQDRSSADAGTDGRRTDAGLRRDLAQHRGSSLRCSRGSDGSPGELLEHRVPETAVAVP